VAVRGMACCGRISYLPLIRLCGTQTPKTAMYQAIQCNAC